MGGKRVGMNYDLKISNGLILDGSGAPGFIGDIGIRDGRIVAVGEAPGEAAETLDAGGQAVAPGFVDIHTHYDAQIMWDRMLSISPWHGVTTVVLGNCGFGVAPARPEHRGLLVRTLEKVEGMSARALEAGLGPDWGFETFPQYLDRIEQGGVAINVGVLLGHSPLRLYVMGEDCTERTASEAEVATMRGIVKEALQAGALGLATSKLQAHIGYNGRPVPSRAADFSEIRALASAIPEVGHGMIQTTLGPGLLLEQIETLAVETGAHVSWTALLAGSAFGKSVYKETHAKAREMQARGLPVYPQVTPRPLNFEFQFKEPTVLESMSFFKPVSQADFAGKQALYRDAAFRATFRERFDTAWPSLRQAFEMMVISEYLPDQSLEEQRLVDVAAARGVHPIDLALDLALATDLEARFRLPIANHNEDDVAELLLDQGMVLGLSDAGAHASQLCDACLPTHLLGRWVREKGALPLEIAVRMLSAKPAEVFGITDRGRLVPGLAADIVIFDPATVGAGPLRRVFDLPAEADRLVSDASGVAAVIVNGTILRRHDQDVLDAAASLPGRLLRHGKVN